MWIPCSQPCGGLHHTDHKAVAPCGPPGPAVWCWPPAAYISTSRVALTRTSLGSGSTGLLADFEHSKLLLRQGLCLGFPLLRAVIPSVASWLSSSFHPDLITKATQNSTASFQRQLCALILLERPC